MLVRDTEFSALVGLTDFAPGSFHRLAVDAGEDGQRSVWASWGHDGDVVVQMFGAGDESIASIRGVHDGAEGFVDLTCDQGDVGDAMETVRLTLSGNAPIQA